MANLDKQMKDYRLTTAQIIYYMPDHQHLLQEYIWQEYDIAPQYPTLRSFLDFWVEKIEGKLHSVYVAKQELITPGDYRFAEWQGTIQ
ncbi:MAG: Usg family protein [Alphaproteobacteria bacterium]|nr:Usg family protein [Alphaproteobacteria bacterium]